MYTFYIISKNTRKIVINIKLTKTYVIEMNSTFGLRKQKQYNLALRGEVSKGNILWFISKKYGAKYAFEKLKLITKFKH